MNLSYWEIKTWLTNIDYTIVGSGIVGINCALQLRNRFPKAKILILEKGILPQGASTKNAGFACFGSLSEIIDDLNSHTKIEVINLIKKRIKGLNLLRETLSDKAIDYQNNGGFELFSKQDNKLLQDCLDRRNEINTLLNPIFNQDIFKIQKNSFGFKNIEEHYIFNAFEGQIDTGKMMNALLKKAQINDIKILNNIQIEEYVTTNSLVKIKTNQVDFNTSKLLIATNGFASRLINEKVEPARAQVLITKPIKNLKIKGTFHLDKGYYYFRNIENRILFGGGRNLDFKTENTSVFGQTEVIQNKLETLLKTTILPNTSFEIAHRWSGIMGIGKQKKPIVKQIENNVYCGIRLGGMGVAIGSLVGKELADLV
ncbi:FAD-binding oxidoreductase [Lacinutrix sp. MedPE-SW]|uniref:NAD(P)/FAD-dependent oxidoreductase n=1 Tax=Lacinutrix sp. MedPE-SW TaxID=1860087 RepID=UPI000913AF5C|nr:FAD-dependent oxidoreductase [Lacinutrix sp. MedPE-SW]OIQ23397.1 MAG: FAD-dependent oxidoreductase [Lacinutrix sp. MedPE-SW]